MTVVGRQFEVRAKVWTPVPETPRVEQEYTQGRRFRVTWVEEQLLDGVYRLWLKGPILTAVGRDHSGGHTGLRSYSSASDADFPGHLRPLVFGEEQMRHLFLSAADAVGVRR
jgi:hypothetical protein